MDTSYIETLSDEDISNLEFVVTEPVLKAFRSGTETADQLKIAKLVDGIIADAPAQEVDLKIYQVYKTEPKFSEPGELTELGYLFGVTSQPNPKDNYSVFKIVIPAGVPALELSDGVYILARGAIIVYTPTANVDATPNPKLLNATIRPALVASVLQANFTNFAHLCWGHKCTTEQDAKEKTKPVSKAGKVAEATVGPEKGKEKPTTKPSNVSTAPVTPAEAPVESEKDKLARRQRTSRVATIGGIASNIAVNDSETKKATGTKGTKSLNKNNNKLSSKEMGPFHGQASHEAIKAERIRRLKKAALVTVGVIAVIGLLLGGAQVAATSKENKVTKYRASVANEYLRREEAGHQVKSFSFAGKSGKTLSLHDHTGKITQEQANSLLKDLDEIHSKVKIKGNITPEIEVHEDSQILNGAKAFVVYEKGAKKIHINRATMFDKLKEEADAIKEVKAKTGRDLVAPSYATTNHDTYTLAHEYGHLVEANDARATRHARRIYSRLQRQGKEAVSAYGSSNEREAHSEAFAEHYMTGGKTNSETARMYAKKLRWK